MPNSVLYIELFQPFAQYRNPFTFYYAQTYPLPPRSTVIGMLQNALDDWYGNEYGDSWDELKVSIHGEFESFFFNYQNMIKGYPFVKNGILMVEDKGEGEDIDSERKNKSKKDKRLYGEGKRAQRSPVPQGELFNGRLFLFLECREELIDALYNVLSQPKKVLSLGRSEDVIFIRQVSKVDKLKRVPIRGDIKIPYSTYIIEEGFPIENKKYPVFYIPLSVKFQNNGERIKYKYEIKKDLTERDVRFKPVIYTARDYSILLKEGNAIDVDYYKIGDKEYPIVDKWGWL